MHLGKVSLRMRLEHFLDKDDKKGILKALEDLNHLGTNMISLILWFDEDNTKINLKDAIASIEDGHHWKTTIVSKKSINPNDFVWFDMRCHNDKDVIPSNCRFQYNYGDTNQIVSGISKFSDAITFFNNQPPKEKKVERKQKRNDL